jgi:hypothetical protein
MNVLNCPAFNQGDAKWKDLIMFPGPWALGPKGCMVVCVTSMLHQFGYITETPDTVNAKLVKAGGFLSNSNLIYAKVAELWANVAFVSDDDTTANIRADANPVQVTTAIERAKKLIRRGIPVILNVDNVGNDGIADHYVLAVDDNLTVMNPDGGTYHAFELKYGDPKTGIKGITIFAGAPMSFLDNTTKDQMDIGVTIGKLAVANKQVSNLMVKESLQGLTR